MDTGGEVRVQKAEPQTGDNRQDRQDRQEELSLRRSEATAAISSAEGTDGTTAKAAKCAKAEDRSGEESYHEGTKSTKSESCHCEGAKRLRQSSSFHSTFAIRHSTFPDGLQSEISNLQSTIALGPLDPRILDPFRPLPSARQNDLRPARTVPAGPRGIRRTLRL